MLFYINVEFLYQITIWLVAALLPSV